MGTHENTKLCAFTSTNNSDFIYTPIAPPPPAANFYEIKPALWNLVMKEQFFVASTNNAAVHLNNFVELCERQKYKDVTTRKTLIHGPIICGALPFGAPWISKHGTPQTRAPRISPYAWRTEKVVRHAYMGPTSTKAGGVRPPYP
jgi:hypothetical protein